MLKCGLGKFTESWVILLEHGLKKYKKSLKSFVVKWNADETDAAQTRIYTDFFGTQIEEI